jgi:O-succinylbenzoate synthase
MLPDLTDVLSGVRVVTLPLVTRFRGITVREAALWEGPAGWTEFSPFVEYGDDEAAHWLAATYDFGGHEPPPSRRSVNSVRVNATIPAVSPDRVADLLASFPGCRTAKIKVAEPGQNLSDDLARVARVREVMGPDARLRVDANGGWSLGEARAAAEQLREFSLEYMEQPCASVDELRDLRALDLGIPIAADESIRKASDPLLVRDRKAADVIVVKAAPLGGISRAIDLVERVGLPAVVSSALETSVGLAMGAFLAAALPDTYDAGLGTASLLAADITREPVIAHNGSIDVRRVVPDKDLLAKHDAGADRTAWWAERITRCHRVLEATA